MKCPKCYGAGYKYIDCEFGKYNPAIRCTFCWGKKELDWVELVIGVDHAILDKWIDTLLTTELLNDDTKKLFKEYLGTPDEMPKV